jgi:hypothetical protein
MMPVGETLMNAHHTAQRALENREKKKRERERERERERGSTS